MLTYVLENKSPEQFRLISWEGLIDGEKPQEK